MIRPDGRSPTDIRTVAFRSGQNPYAEGSAICSFGHTQVLCTASLEEGVPSFLEGSGQGWVTGEYAMLPRSTHTRTGRDHQRKGRAQEISRLLGRALRAATDLSSLAGYTVRVDCDVLVADGGTRTAAISGGYLALALALKTLGLNPLRPVCALSVGKYEGELIVDLNYEEDSQAEVDLNLVMTQDKELVEIQGTAEKGVFSPDELSRMLKMAWEAAPVIFTAQQAELAKD